jgi:hypothetical protein
VMPSSPNTGGVATQRRWLSHRRPSGRTPGLHVRLRT